jgi:hypothetical protein
MPFDPVSYAVARRASLRAAASVPANVMNLAPPTGLTRSFTAGRSISAGQVVSLGADGNVYPSSPSYPNIVGVAVSSANAGDSVSVLVMGVAQVTADGPVNVGDPVTFSPSTPGRVVSYAGHSHSVSLSTGSFLTGVGTDTNYNIDSSGILTHTHAVTSGSAVTGVSVGAAINRVLGVALTPASAAGQTITVLVLPSRG